MGRHVDEPINRRNLDENRRAVIRESRIPVGTVLVHQAFIDAFKRRGCGAYFTEDDLFNTIERHLKNGVSFMMLHAAITRDLALRSNRVIPIVSRGGDMMAGCCSTTPRTRYMLSGIMF